jgi:predicted helicase
LSETTLRDYLGKVERDYKRGIATEHSYRGTLQDLLETLNSSVTATNEPKRIKCGAPDYVIERNRGTNTFTIGYVEAKDAGMNLDEIERDSRLSEPKTREGKQLKRYLHALDNLVFTNYLEFRWYLHGEKRATAILSTPQADKRLPFDREKAKEVAQLLHNFLEHSAEPIRNPPELAKRMARLAHMIRDIIIDAFEQKAASDELKDLYSAFKDVLLPELTGAEFADMFAQTLAYGLFAARYNHKGAKAFNRNDAAKEIPRTNPFLRRLFSAIAGPELDDEPFAGFVDDLAQLLAVTDMEAVLADFGKHTRQEDPIVHFYETFLAQYDPKMRELRGVYYTPEPVVSYIVRSVDALLRTHFDCPEGLGDDSTVSYTYVDDQGERRAATSPRVLLLDPACGTGTFLYYVIEHIRESYRQTGNAGMWSGYVREQLLPRLFGFELLMAPYAMAHLKLGMQLAAVDLPQAERATWAYDFASDERLGIFLTNTLEEAMKRSEVMFGRYISEEANEAAKIKQERPVMVVLGNPPYSGHSANKGEWISALLHENKGNYFEVDGHSLGERNPKWLNDDYVKFIRFAQWRIEQTGYGILAFITNHGYLDNPTFRGMRQSLMQSFGEIYVLDLHGNSKKKDRSPDGTKDENVFDIQQGVAIGIFVKRQQKNAAHTTVVHHAHLWGLREVYEKIGQEKRLVGGKYHWLAEHDITTTEWTSSVPESPFYFFIPQNSDLQSEYKQGWQLTEAMLVNGVGMTTARDHVVIDFEEAPLLERASIFKNSTSSNEELCRLLDIPVKLGWDISNARKLIQKEADLQLYIKPVLYRPFDNRLIFYHDSLVWRTVKRIMHHMLAGRNIGFITTRQTRDNWDVFTTRSIMGHKSLAAYDINTIIPLYLYPDTANAGLFDVTEPSNAPGGRRPNLSPAFITDISNKLNMQFIPDSIGDLHTTFGPEDIFHYMYAVFHSPAYRERYAEFLKIDFPRLPLTSNVELFRALRGLGERLVGLHLMEKFGSALPGFPIKGDDTVEKVEYTTPGERPETGRVWINKTQYFEGVAPDVWEFHVGGYQVCHKWLKDRKGRELTNSDKKHYQRVVAALGETIALMGQVDAAIDERGGWPLE